MGKKTLLDLIENASARAVGSGSIGATVGSFKSEWPDPEKPKPIRVKKRKKSGNEKHHDKKP